MSKTIVFIASLLFSKICFAQALSFTRNARTFETQQSSLTTKGLAHACLSLEINPDGLPCNPAMVPFAKKSKLRADLLLSNGYSTIDSVRKLLKGQITQELVDSLFGSNQFLQFEANGELNFLSSLFNARYTPMTVKTLSVIRNEANPDIEIYAVEDSGLTLQYGTEVFDDFFLGAQIKLINRKFIRETFKLLQLGTPGGLSLLTPNKQNLVFIEPGFSYSIESKWNLRLSGLLVNTGFGDTNNSKLELPSEMQVGFGATPPLSLGQLDLLLDFRSMNFEESSLEKLRLGALYHYGAMYLSCGIDANGISSGVFYSINRINAGVLYSTTKLINEDDEFVAQTVYVQLGFEI